MNSTGTLTEEEFAEVIDDADEWLARIIKNSTAEARAEGLVEGEERVIGAFKSDLLHKLEDRFGPTPEAWRQAIGSLQTVGQTADLIAAIWQTNSAKEFEAMLHKIAAEK